MATLMITLKLEDRFLKDIDSVVAVESYQNRTEFIRNAIREKLEESKLRESMCAISPLKGAAKKNVSEKEYEANRKKAFDELSKRLR